MYSDGNSDVEILSRMKGEVSSDIDTSEGSFLHDALSPAAEELAQGYIKLDEVLKRVFASTAAENGYSTELENRCAEFGISRKQGVAAKGQVTFLGSDNVTVPTGTLVTTSGGLKFITSSPAVILNGKGSASIEAYDFGIKYNVPSNTITLLPSQVAGVIGVSNEAPTSGGADVESDSDLLMRFLLKAGTPATSGNAAHYKIWATEVPGVGDAEVIPLWNGPGTVKVVILDSNKRSPSKDIVSAVQSHIEEERPIGAQVTVEGAEEVPIDISVSLQLLSGADLTEVKTQISNGVQAYLEELAFKDAVVRYTRIANVLLDVEDIVDYKDLTVNLGGSNIEVPEGSVAVLGTVSANEA